MEPIQEPPSNLNDIGTRYQHLNDYRDSLEFAVKMLQDRGLHSLSDKQRFMKFTAAHEAVSITIDAFAGLKEKGADYYMYKLLNSVPKDAETVPSERGTPLI